ncbi:MAG: hypothetical protein NTY41_17400 [Proteobacteria bacterium]|nr:hypothetical protein [Pseudomonadota bacterium]
MLVTATSNQPPQALLPDSAAPASRQGNSAHKGAAATASGASAAPPGESLSSADSDRVTLSTSGELQLDLVPVYAEIWKNGTKVAEIDVHGGVNPLNSLVASAQGSAGGAGTLLAARRAAEIVRAIGGEIRVGGQVMDGQTLDMRARLKMAYGI